MPPARLPAAQYQPRRPCAALQGSPGPRFGGGSGEGSLRQITAFVGLELAFETSRPICSLLRAVSCSPARLARGERLWLWLLGPGEALTAQPSTALIAASCGACRPAPGLAGAVGVRARAQPRLFSSGA